MRYSAFTMLTFFRPLLRTNDCSALPIFYGTMASADFSQFVVTAHFLCVCETSPGKNEIFPLICLPHLRMLIPCCYWTFPYVGGLSSTSALYAISVRQAKGLPTASFRFFLTTDTLAVQLCTSHHRACSGPSPIRLRPCRVHQTKGLYKKSQ